ncbi:MAG: cation diffusion facilitator family transporter [candidate division KSB1 bacterium]|nr:cation diffusion facilitator family transporter [candidate division KSB1 bacterium]
MFTQFKFFQKKANLIYLSLLGAVLTMALKFSGYLITGSVGVLSDAAESIINLIASLLALIILSIASRPPDATHSFGHEKAEYFSSGVEGALIVAAAIGILYSATQRLMHPRALENIDLGVTIVAMAALLNLAIALFLLKAAREFDSITLEADAKHLLTDVYTSGGVIAGLFVVKFTGWQIMDTLIAYAIGGNIILTGFSLVKRSVRGLMDYRLPAEEIEKIDEVIHLHENEVVGYHNLRTRKAGPKRFIEFHMLVQGKMTVQQAHDLCEQIEAEIQARLPNSEIIIHVEPSEDVSSWDLKEGALGRVFREDHDNPLRMP